MTGKECTLQEFFFGTEPLIIPVYQRNYTWGIEDCKQLLDDIMDILPEKKKSHFIGSVVHVKHSDGNIIIDGQQRITTLSILLLATRNALKSGALKTDNDTLIKEIEFSFLINQFSKDQARRMKLKPFREDGDAFEALFGDDDSFVPNSKITTNYNYFFDRIIESQVNPDELFDAIKRLEFVRITLEPDHGDNAQQIFESINSTGVRLTETDKIRNFVLMNLDASKQEEYYNQYWLKIEQNTGSFMEDFVRDYLTIFCGTIPRQSEVYRIFKGYASSHYISDVLPLLDSMKHYSSIFKNIKQCKVGGEETNETMYNLSQLELSVINPFLMAYLDYAQQNSLPEEETSRILKVIETFLWRRIMSGYYNTGLNKVFYNLHSRVIKMMYDNWKYSDVLIYMLQQSISYWVFPNDKEFKEAFKYREVYKMRSNYRLYFFTRLEESLNKEAAGVKKKIEDNILSIEHVMPQTLTEDWRKELGPDFTDEDHTKWKHNIGNLTLTAYNSEYSNRKFSEKRDGVPSLPDMKGFKDSCVAMNKYISTCEHWTVKEMETRCNMIADHSVTLWPYPVTNYVPKTVEDEFIPITAELQFKGRSIKSYLFNGATVQVDSWADAFTRIVRSFYEINSDILTQLAQDKNEVFYSTEDGTGYNKISEGLYLLVSCNTERKISQLCKLLSLYHMEDDDICVSMYSRNSTSAKSES